MSKKWFYSLIFLALLLPSHLFAQWYQQNPLPPVNRSILAMSFVSSTTGWAVGDLGMILKTTNGGVSWMAQTSTVNDSLNAVCFTSGTTGWIATSRGEILSTTNGGNTWTPQIVDSAVTFNALYFASASIGWAAGSQGAIYKTTDGGATWKSQASGTTNAIYGVNFVDTNLGWAVGFGRTILKTTNGGATWTVQTTSSSNYLYAVTFISQTTGWAVGDQGTILKTTDGGATWAGQSAGTSESIFSINFVSATVGWFGTYYDGIYKTTDAGNTWTKASTFGNYSVMAIAFSGTSNGWLGSDNGYAFYTSDGGVTWNKSKSGPTVNWNSVSFKSNSYGVAVGDAGRVNRTTDGGASWNIQILDSLRNLTSVYFATVDTGWLVGNGGYICKTVDTGKTWVPQLSSTTNDLTSVNFISSKMGWAAGGNGTILHTTDGGATWSVQPTGTTYSLTCVFFTSPQVGYACGGNQNGILKTTNGGAYWYTIANYANAKSLYFISPTCGWVVGSAYSGAMKTTDGGNSWTYAQVSDYYSLSAITFVSPSVGWITGVAGGLYYTTNGGNSWAGQSSQTYRYQITGESMYAISAISPTTAWAVGANGTILKTTANNTNWIAVISPSSGLNWVTGTTQSIQWNSSGVSNVKIEYSTNNGTNWMTIIGSTPASAGTYSWKVTGPASTTCVIRVSDAANPANYGLSGGNFEILPTPMVQLLSPVGGESWQVGTRHAIKWNDSTVTNVKLEYSTNSGTSWTTIVASTPASADSLSWVVPNTPASACRVRISDSSNAATSDISAANFSITASSTPVLSIVSPNGGESFEAGTQKAITWVSSGITNISINYSTDGGYSWKVVITSTPASSGTYTWTVPNEPTSYCLIKISDATNSATTSRSASQFSIFTRSLSLTSPVGGEIWRTGDIKNITWSPNNIDSLRIELTTDNGKTWSTVVANIPGTVSSFPWYIPNTPSTQCKIKITDLANIAIKDTSDSTFTIYHPAITLLSPNGGESWVEGSSHTVTWNSNNVTNVNLEYSADKGLTWNTIATKLTASTGSYAWTLPYVVSTNCKVRISDNSNTALWDTSAATFSITRALTYSVDSLAFGTNYVYNPTALTINISNQGNKTYYLTLTSSNTAFTLSTSGISLDANSSQTLSVTFSPTTAGVQKGKLSIQYYSPDFATNTTDSVKLSGTGKAITYPTTVALSKTFSFSYTGNPSDYRMVGVPGKFSSTLDQIFTGTRGQDWDAYMDNGSAMNYLVEFRDSAKFAFSPGVGYWALSKNSASLSQSVSTADVLTNYTYAIPLHSGWNIISDPFEKSVQWSKIVLTNSLDTTALLYAWSGVWNTASQLVPYQGYYFYNSFGLSTLKIPYNPDGSLSKIDNSAPSYYLSPEHIALSLNGNGKTYSRVAASFDSRATADYNKLDYMAPAGDFEEAGIRMIHSFSNSAWNQYFVECRPEIGNGQLFALKARNTTGKDLTLQVNEITGLPDDQQVFLVDKRLSRMIDLRATDKVQLSGMHKESDYELLVGSASFIQAEKELLLPKSFALFQNYPNPFNPATIISYQLPVSGKVMLKVYDILGREVKTLVNEMQDAGVHEIVFNAGNMSSGVYFYRIESGSFKAVKKLMLIK